MLREPLDERVMAGFGGVAEYGITVRWDKNFLKVVRLLLERRDRFALFGGVRFGGTLDAEDAFALGFDHVALAAGAGRPTVLDLPNGLAQRRAHRVGFPDGAAAHRRGQDRFDREHAGAPAGRRHRRRPDGDRHGDRGAGVLPGAGREVPGALRSAGRGQRRERRRGGVDRRRSA